MAIDAKEVAYLQVRVDSKGVATMNQRLAATQAQTKTLQGQFKSFGRTTRRLGATLSTFVTLPIAAVFAGAAFQAGKFEEAMIEVQKVTDKVTADKLSKSIRKLSTQIPVATDQLAKLAADAARFGITGTKNIENFTKVAAMMGAATELSIDQAAESLAKLAKISQTPISQVENLGSAINSLSNTAATSSQEIVDNMLRASKGLTSLGATNTEMAALSATLNEVSPNAARAGTQLNRLASVLLRPSRIDDISAALGVTVEQFKNMRDTDPVGLIRTLAESFAQGGDQSARLRDALGEVSSKAIAGFAQNLDGLTKNLKTSYDAFQAATSLAREAALAFDTFFSKVKILWNNIKDLGIGIGKELLPVLEKFTGHIKTIVQGFQGMSKGTKQAIVQYGLLAVAIGPAIYTFGLLIKPVTALIGLYGTMTATVIPAVVSAFGTLQVAAYVAATDGIGVMIANLTILEGLIVATGIGALITAIAGIGYAAYDSYQDLSQLADEADRLVNIDIKGKSWNELKTAISDIDQQIAKIREDAKFSFTDASSYFDLFTTGDDIKRLSEINKLEKRRNELVKKREEIRPVGIFKTSGMILDDLGLSLDSILAPKKPFSLLLPVKVKTKVAEPDSATGLPQGIKDLITDIQTQLNNVTLKAGIGDGLKEILLPDFNKFKARLGILKSGLLNLLNEGVKPGTDLWNKYKNKVLEAKQALIDFNAQQAQANLRISDFKGIKIFQDGIPTINAGPLKRAISPREQRLKSLRSELERLKGLRAAFAPGELDDDIAKVRQEIEGLTGETKKLNGIGRQLNFTFQSAFEDAIFSAKSFGDILSSLLEDIARAITQVYILKPLLQGSDGAGGIIGALGGLFGGGSNTTTSSANSIFGGTSQIADALVTSDGQIIQGHPKDNWLAFQGSPDRLGGGSNVKVNVYNQGNNNVDVKQRKTNDGIELDVLVEQQVRSGINNGRFDDVMTSNYGINRSGY